MPQPLKKVTEKSKNFKYGLILISLVIFGSLIFKSGSTSAVPNSVIINEIMYNPTGGDAHEFLELYNTTGSPIDISNWAFTQGITHTFANGTTIPANGYFVMASNFWGYQATYGGGNPDVQWTSGSLSNGGEALTLVDENAAVINTLTYDDIAPWPTSPDGSGPSLELKQVNLDNTDAANWGASIGSPTPGLVNSWAGISLPVITSVNDPNDVTDADTVTITANIADADTVELAYKVNFDSDVVVPMLDDGLSGDGAASDGQYAADIPAQSAGQLVRFKISATNNDGTQTSPSVNDSMEYGGYVIEDPSVTSNAPIIQWFMDDTDFNEMVTTHRYDNVYLDAVVAYGNEVYDNTMVRVRGEVGRDEPKKPFKFKLPGGYTIDLPGGENIDLNEFNLLANVFSEGSAVVPTLWWAIQQSGAPVPTDIMNTRIQKNGEFYGLYIFADKYDKEWRTLNGYDSGELYEDAAQVESGGAADTARLLSFKNDIIALDNHDPAKLDFVLDNYDIPKTFNYMAAIAMIGGYDHSTTSNSLQYYDRDETNRWHSLIWDIDGNLLSSNANNLSPFNHRSAGNEFDDYTYAPVYFQPSLKPLYLRRVRTITDKLYANDQLLNKYLEISELNQADQALDLAKWPRGAVRGIQGDQANIMRLKLNLLTYMRTNWGVPASQTDAEREQVYIDEATYDVDSANEYIIISSNAGTPVDISGWEIEEISYTIPEGSVVPANGSIYILRDDISYRTSHSSVLVAGQYTNSLSPGGGKLTLKTEIGTEIDTYNY